MTLLHTPIITVYDTSGAAYPSAKLDTLLAGTSTSVTTYQDAGFITAHANPIIADANGVFPDVFLKTEAYKFVVKDSSGTHLRTLDDYHVGDTPLLKTDYDEIKLCVDSTNMTGFDEAIAQVETYKLGSGDTIYGGANGPRLHVALSEGKHALTTLNYSYPYGGAVLIEGDKLSPDFSAKIKSLIRREQTFSSLTTETEFLLDVAFEVPSRASDLYVYETTGANTELKAPKKDSNWDYYIGDIEVGSPSIPKLHVIRNVISGGWDTLGSSVRIMHGYDLELEKTGHGLSKGDYVHIESINSSAKHADCLNTRHEVISATANEFTVRIIWVLDEALDLGTIPATTADVQVRKMDSILKFDAPDPDPTDDTANAYGILSNSDLNMNRLGVVNSGTYHDTTSIGVVKGSSLSFLNSYVHKSPKIGAWARDGSSLLGNNSQLIGVRENGWYIAQGSTAQLASSSAYACGVALRLSDGEVECSGFTCRNNFRGVALENNSSIAAASLSSKFNQYYDLLLEEGTRAYLPSMELGETGKTALSYEGRSGSFATAENAVINGEIKLAPGSVLYAPGLTGTYSVKHDLGNGTTNTAVNVSDSLGGGIFTDMSAIIPIATTRTATSIPAIKDLTGSTPRLDFLDSSDNVLSLITYSAGKFIFRVGTSDTFEVTASSIRSRQADMKIGESDEPWGEIHTNKGIYVDGTKVVGNQGASIGDISISYTTGDPSYSPSGSVTVVNGALPTTSELLELILEVNDKLETLQSRTEDFGIIAA